MICRSSARSIDSSGLYFSSEVQAASHRRGSRLGCQAPALAVAWRHTPSLHRPGPPRTIEMRDAVPLQDKSPIAAPWERPRGIGRGIAPVLADAGLGVAIAFS